MLQRLSSLYQVLVVKRPFITLSVLFLVALLAAAGVSLTATAVSLVSERRKARAASPYAYLLAASLLLRKQEA